MRERMNGLPPNRHPQRFPEAMNRQPCFPLNPMNSPQRRISSLFLKKDCEPALFAFTNYHRPPAPRTGDPCWRILLNAMLPLKSFSLVPIRDHSAIPPTRVLTPRDPCMAIALSIKPQPSQPALHPDASMLSRHTRWARRGSLFRYIGDVTPMPLS